MSAPWNRIWPLVGRVSVAIICISVVLPAPLWPIRPTTPAVRLSETPSTAVTSLPKRFTTLRISSIGAPVNCVFDAANVRAAPRRRRRFATNGEKGDDRTPKTLAQTTHLRNAVFIWHSQTVVFSQ